MLLKNIIVIDPDDLTVDFTSHDKSHLAKFCDKEEHEGIESDSEMNLEFVPDFITSLSTNLQSK